MTEEKNYPEWNTTEWLEMFNSAMHPVNHHALRQLRQLVYGNTLDAVQKGGYTMEDGSVVLLENDDELVRNTRFYRKEIPSKEPLRQYETEISVVHNDSLACAWQFIQSGESDVCVLNMASRSNPGGGVFVGAGSQEEYLFRCTNYYRSLYQYVDFSDMYGISRASNSYPLDRHYGGIFTPQATVFRDLEVKGYRYLANPWKVNFIAVPAISHPSLEGDRIVDALIHPIRKKMRTIFRIAIDNGQKVLILGAWGCGAFANPPRHIAELFKETLQEEEFQGCFKQVVFAIKGGPRGGNFQPFKDVFEAEK